MPTTSPGFGLYEPKWYATIIAGAASGRRTQNTASRTGRGAASARRHPVEPLHATTPGVMPLPSVTTVITSMLFVARAYHDSRESGPPRAFGWTHPLWRKSPFRGSDGLDVRPMV